MPLQTVARVMDGTLRANLTHLLDVVEEVLYLDEGRKALEVKSVPSESAAGAAATAAGAASTSPPGSAAGSAGGSSAGAAGEVLIARCRASSSNSDPHCLRVGQVAARSVQRLGATQLSDRVTLFVQCRQTGFCLAKRTASLARRNPLLVLSIPLKLRVGSPLPLCAGSVMDVAGGGVRMRVEWGFGSSCAFASSLAHDPVSCAVSQIMQCLDTVKLPIHPPQLPQNNEATGQLPRCGEPAVFPTFPCACRAV